MNAPIDKECRADAAPGNLDSTNTDQDGDCGRFQLLASALTKLTGSGTRAEILEIVRIYARQLIRADGVSIVLRDAEQCYYAHEDSPEGPLWQGQRFPLMSCISGWAMLNNQTAIIEDVYQDDRIPHAAYKPTFVKSLVMVPVGGPDPVAAIGAYWGRTWRPNPIDVAVLETLARAAGTALYQRAVESQLRESEQRLRSAFSNALAGFCLIGLDGRFLEVNGRFAEIFGYAHADLESHSFFDLTHAEDRDRERFMFAQLQASNIDRIQIEKRCMHKSGQLVWVKIYGGLVADENGLPSRLTVVTIDVTQEKLAQERLRRNESLLRIAGNLAKVGGWSVDLASGTMQWSDQVCAIHEVAPGRSGHFDQGIEFYAPEYRGIIAAAFDQCSRNGVPYDLELEIITAKGSRNWVRTMGEAQRDSSGRIIGVHGAFLDISERKRNEQSLTSVAQRLVNTLDSITDGFFTVDCDWRFTYVNDEAVRLLRLPREQLLTRSVWEVYPDLLHSEFYHAYQRAVAEQTKVSLEAYYSPFGQWFDVHAYPFQHGLSVYFQDVTTRRASEERLRLLETCISRLNDSVIVMDAERMSDDGYPIIIYVNPAFEQQTGYRADEAIGRTLDLLHGPTTQRGEAHQIQNAVQQWLPARVELIHCRKTGDESWTDLDLVPVLDRSGRHRYWVAICRDITHRKLSEAALRQSEQRFQYVARATNDVIWDWDLETGSVWRSNDATRLFGKAGTMPGMQDALLNLIHPDDRDRVLRSIQQAINGHEEVWTAEYSLQKENGDYAYVLDRGFVVRDTDGHPLRMVGSVTDLSDRKQYEEKLREQATLLDEANDAIIVRSLDQRILYWNKAAEKQYGWRADEVLGRCAHELLYAESSANFKEAQAILIQHGDFTGRITHLRKDGSRILVHTHWVLVRHEDGSPKSILAIHTDLSDRIDLEERLFQAQKLEALGQLTGGIAHDFNNLLTVIIGTAEILCEELASSPDQFELAKMIESAGEKGAELTSRLLAFSRRQTLEPKLIDPAEVIADMHALLERSLGENITLRIISSQRRCATLIDPVQFESAILNLCINARDAMPRGGELTIETQAVHVHQLYDCSNPDMTEGEYILVSVSDTGVGMSKEVAAHAFEPFFTTKPRGAGSGLGLSMVYGFIKQSRGQIQIHSEPKQGTVIRLYLPSSLSQRTGTLDESPAASDAKGMVCILLVENDEAAHEHGIDALTSLGFKVVTATDMDEALLMLRHGLACDLLLIGFDVPGNLNSVELEKEICRLRPRLPVLYAAGHPDAIIRGHADENTVMTLLHKHHHWHTLAEKVRIALVNAQTENLNKNG